MDGWAVRVQAVEEGGGVVCVCVCVCGGSTSRALSACRCALIVAPDAGSMSEMSRSTVPALTQELDAEKVGIRSYRVCCAADSSWSRAVVAALVEQGSACLWCPRSSTASSRRARAPHANLPSVRELRIGLRVLVVTSSESLSKIHSRPVLLRRTVLKPQLLLFVTCMGEANALRKSRWKGELLLVKAQLRVFHRDGRPQTQ